MAIDILKEQGYEFVSLEEMLVYKNIDIENNKAYRFFKYLYENSNIYLDRKYSRFARYRGNMIDERDNIGEGCDANTELTD